MFVCDSREKIRRLMIAVNQIDELYYKILRTLGIKGNAFVLFYAIADGKPYSQKKICDEWTVPRTTINTIVQEYIQKGLIRLVSSGHKEKEIKLTDSGRYFVNDIFAPIFLAEENAIKYFLETDLVEQTEKFTKILEKEFSQIKNGESES